MSSIQFCSQTPFMNFGGSPQISSLMPQFSETSVGQEVVGRERDDGNNGRNFDDRRSVDTWQHSSHGDKRQSSPRRDQRNENFRGNRNANENSGERQSRWGQSDTAASRNDRSDRDYPWEQANMPTPRDGTVRREPPREDRNHRDSRWEEPRPKISRDNRSRNDTMYELSQMMNDRQPVPLRNNKSDLPKGDYEDRKTVQGNWGVGYGQQIPTVYPAPLNSNFGASGQTSMFGRHVTVPVQQPSGSQNHGQNRWDNSIRTGGRSQEISQQKLIERNRPERVSRPSPRYEERDVSRPSKYVPPNKRPKNLRGVQEPPPKRLANQPYARPNMPNTIQKPSPSQPQHKQKTNMKTLLHKDQTWRHQAASALARQTLNSMDITRMGSKDQIVKKLKASIKSRIDVMMGDKVAVPMEEIIKMYRQRFHVKTDQAFIVVVLDSIKDDEENEANTGKPVSDTFC